LHRHSVGALTSRAAIPVAVSAFAIRLMGNTLGFKQRPGSG
jgi:hypothetical protein